MEMQGGNNKKWLFVANKVHKTANNNKNALANEVQ